MNILGGSGQGFTVLLEAIKLPPDCESEKELLEDAITLLNGKWNLDGTVLVDGDGKDWGWVCCTRFLVANNTIQKALGEMTPEFVRFYRGPPTQTFDDAVRLVRLKKRWKVAESNPEEGGETSSGGSGEGPPWRKRMRL